PSEPNIKSINPTFTEQGHSIVIASSTHQHRTDIKIYQQGEPSQEIVHAGHLVLKSLPDNEIQGSTTEKILSAEDFNDRLLDKIIR
ncbi:MAG: hypothetical protein IKE05_05125, partial [Clostridia bacterium]|nr:hypothetical protein [Clostridia bacterium]